MRRSGLQTDVLTLYRRLLKAALKKDGESRSLSNIVKIKFREKAMNISRTDFRVIEHELRYGYKQIKLLEMPGFSTASLTSTRTETNSSWKFKVRIILHWRIEYKYEWRFVKICYRTVSLILIYKYMSFFKDLWHEIIRFIGIK